MVPHSVPLTELPTAELEVWGINGRPTALCGRALPVVRHKPSDSFTIPSTATTVGRWESREVIDEYLAQGRLLRLSEPFALTEADVSDYIPWTDMLVAWVDPGVFPLLGWNPKIEPRLKWLWWHVRVVKNDFDRPLWVCLAQEGKLDSAFGAWAVDAIRRYDDLAVAHQPMWADLQQLADFGLSAAAHEPGVRYSLYTRYCAALYYSPNGRPEGAHNVFKLFVRREYPTVDWDRFREDMRVVVLRGKDVAAYRNGSTKATQTAEPPASPKPAPQSVEQVVRGLDVD